MKSLRHILLLLAMLIFLAASAQEGIGTYCTNAEPLCGSGLFSYPNTSGFNPAESGPDYGCLLLARNPAWFYFQIDQPGDIQLKIEQSTIFGNLPDLDVDFIVYGPFTDPRLPCNSNLIGTNIVDCSYRIDFVEYLNLSNTTSGEYYLLMITNFSLNSGYITVTQTSGTATTNCVLVEEPIVVEEFLCEGSIEILDASIAGATHYEWYSQNAYGEFEKLDREFLPLLEVSNPGIYKAQALNASNVVLEQYQFRINLLDNSPLKIIAEVVSNTFIEENDIEISVLNGPVDTYEYSMDGGSWQLEPFFKNVSMGEHEIQAVNSTGCRIGFYTLTVMDYPLYFTPNGDGFNDTWKINGQSELQAKVSIFDRYGKLIKQVSPNSAGWDGTYNGAIMPTSDYWFIVTYTEPKDGSRKQFEAHFALKR